jgi:hypothetical protein
MTKPKKKKKEPTFRKIENGMVFTSENMILVGLPIEVETKGSAGGGISLIGGGAKGEKSTKVKYEWRVISGSPLPSSEMEELKESVAVTSNTIVASLGNATIAATVYCKKCRTPNPIYGKFCSNCGNPL